MPPIPSTTKRLVIFCPSWVGDSVMATPVLRAAREALPGACITAVVRPGLDDLLAGAPWLDETVAIETKALLGPLAVARRLRRRRPDASLLLPNSFRSALSALLSGAAARIGYDRYGRGALLTGALRADRAGVPVPAVEYYARLAEFAFGLDPIDRRLELAVTESQRRSAEAVLEGVPRPFALLSPGANKAAKRWPPHRFAEVADRLAREHGLAAAVTGSPAERSLAEAVATATAAPVTNLVERGLGLGTLKAVVQEASLLISNDTGPRLIAAALGTPVVALFGPTDPRWTTLRCPHERLVVAEPFLPAALAADDHPGRCAIERIAVGDVLWAAGQLLR